MGSNRASEQSGDDLALLIEVARSSVERILESSALVAELMKRVEQLEGTPTRKRTHPVTTSDMTRPLRT